MGFLDKVRASFARFMSGRYGADQLCMAQVIAALVISIIGSFTGARGIAMILSDALLIWAFFRMFSKDRYRRAHENEVYLTKTEGVRRGFGSVPVRASVGSSTWQTSIFPGSQKGAFVLPIKRAIRTAQRLQPGDTAAVTVELLGERPCGTATDPAAQKALETACCAALKHYVGGKKPISVGSTDCNIPLSLGIPSASFGMYRGGGAHTREEWMEPASQCAGMKAAACVLTNWLKE